MKWLGLLLTVTVAAALLLGCDSEEPATPADRTAVASPIPSTAASPSVGGEPTPASTATATASAEPTTVTPAPIGLEPAFGGREFDRPVELVPYPGGEFLVAEQDGRVFRLDATGEGDLWLDLRDQVSRDGNEEGLLSIALDPAFEANGRLWAYYSVAGGERRTRLAWFEVVGERVDRASEVTVLEVPQPYANHNGGAIRFDAGGLLYLGLGDGGLAADPHGNGQDPTTLLGSVLRLDVSASSAEAPYRVPPDNPFASGADGAPEVWAYGLRNPWRMSFDPATGALWLGDVGQDEFEEIDIIERGGNYGWNRMEGGACFQPPSGCDTSGTVPPVATYGRDGGGCSVTGGVVYRGVRVPEVAGAYLYSDYCSGEVWAISAADPAEPVLIAGGAGSVTAFSVDHEGEMYLLRFDGAIMRVVSP
ncbi:MAG: glucose sorbosone dehydrogenase [Dehalococcoidia bacterium]|nr:glucose sorbosone dehydrogenase [Dehalococcoidia bacterium]